MNDSNVNPNITTETLQNYCRTCLQQNDLKPIFETEYEQKSLPELLFFCISLEVSKEDTMPHNICTSCFTELVRSYTFKQKCYQTDELLRQNSRNLENKKLAENINSLDESKDKKESNAEDNVKHKRPDKNLWKNQVKITEINLKMVKSKTTDPLFTCKICNVEFLTSDSLRSHRKQVKHPEVRNHQCLVCNKMFTSSKLRQHMRVHTKEKPYQCKRCSKGFSMLCNLKRHMMIHTGEKPFVCNICNKRFIQAVTLAEHKRVHTGEAPFVCSYCGKRFTRSTRHKSHLRWHLNEKSNLYSKKMKDDSNLGNTCEICKRIYSSKETLKAHMLRHGEKTFLCSDCGRRFFNKPALLSHSKVHTGVKSYTCTVCNKGFSQSGGLKTHMLIHTHQKPFACHICLKSFTQQHHLKYHMRTHTGERPYQCTYCDKSFALSSNLTVHLRTHTGETRYTCTMCDKQYYHLSSMKKHVLNYHERQTSEQQIKKENAEF